MRSVGMGPKKAASHCSLLRPLSFVCCAPYRWGTMAWRAVRPITQPMPLFMHARSHYSILSVVATARSLGVIGRCVGRRPKAQPEWCD